MKIGEGNSSNHGMIIDQTGGIKVQVNVMIALNLTIHLPALIHHKHLKYEYRHEIQIYNYKINTCVLPVFCIRKIQLKETYAVPPRLLN